MGYSYAEGEQHDSSSNNGSPLPVDYDYTEGSGMVVVSNNGFLLPAEVGKHPQRHPILWGVLCQAGLSQEAVHNLLAGVQGPTGRLGGFCGGSGGLLDPRGEAVGGGHPGRDGDVKVLVWENAEVVNHRGVERVLDQGHAGFGRVPRSWEAWGAWFKERSGQGLPILGLHGAVQSQGSLTGTGGHKSR